MRGSRCQRQKCHIINIIDCSTTTKNNIDNSISALKYSHWMCWLIKTPFYSRTRSSSWTSDWKSQTPGLSMPRWTSPSFTSGKRIWIYCIMCICLYLYWWSRCRENHQNHPLKPHQTHWFRFSGLTSWRTRSFGRSWRSMRSLASWMTPSTRCSTNTRWKQAMVGMAKALMQAWVNNNTKLEIQLFKSNLNWH